MNRKILVTYASKYGATREIAEKISDALCAAGLQAEVLPVEAAGNLDGYEAVVLGSAVYVGKWMKSAGDFLNKNEKSLAARPVWLFSSGPTGDGDPVALLDGWRLPTELQGVIERIQPRDVVVLHGNIDRARLNWIEATAVKALKKPFGDFRDWDAVATWAASIARTMSEAAPSQQ